MPGFAAIKDKDLVEQFADIARQEYIAVGIRSAIHPVADLATDPPLGTDSSKLLAPMPMWRHI